MYEITQQDKGKKVAIEEQPKKLEMESSRPTTRAKKLN